MNLVKPAEVARHFNYPTQTITRWSKQKDWKNELYKKLAKDYIEYLAQESKKLDTKFPYLAGHLSSDALLL